MRIVDKRRDYYDSVVMYGQDRSLTYVRTEREELLPRTHVFSRLFSHFSMLDAGFVSFCGEIHPFFKKTNRLMMFSIAEVDAYMRSPQARSNLSSWQIAEYFAKQQRRSFYPCLSARMREWFSELPKKASSIASEVHIKERSPVFIVSDERRVGGRGVTVLIVNPILKHYDFARRVPPFEAFQKISMFISNLASPEKPIPELTDLERAEKRGFDKWSFRTPPYQVK